MIGINGLTSSRDIELIMDFLPAGEYTLDMIVDGATDQSFALQILNVTKGNAISLAMRSRGGFAGVISKH